MKSLKEKINLVNKLFSSVELTSGNNLYQPILLTGKRPSPTGGITVTGGGVDLNEALDSLLKYGVEYLSDELERWEEYAD